jgi:hypothetical protein
MMNQLWLKAQTAWRLGPVSLARYFAYQLGVRSKLNPVQRLRANAPDAPFFYPLEESETGFCPPKQWQETAFYFGWFQAPLHGRPPRWHENPFNGQAIAHPDRPWWQIPDFDPAVGDIKTIWEPSRFDWALAHACHSRAGDKTAVARLNQWLTDWLSHNPPYFGPNWKCGQETSIRVMHLAMTALLLKQIENPPAGLVDLVRLHLQRIAPTIQYALAQNNNHGSSEAAALFIGGSWLRRLTGAKEAAQWEQNGRRWLEDRVKTLIAADGSFSQYSVNYHRLLLDTLGMVELWRRRLELPAFSNMWLTRAQAATRWLHAFTDAVTGAAPNLGANDGARLLPLDSSDYLDYRPTVQMTAVLFWQQAVYPPGPWDARLHWLGIDVPEARLPTPTSQLFDAGGYALLQNEAARVFIRYPRYRFRPGHTDALHVDFWLNGENILRDGGSYSYAAEAAWQNYFRSCASHNSVQFDGRDQMPRLGRFLYGNWLKTEQREFLIEDGGGRFTAVYQDWQGAQHRRQIQLTTRSLTVTDWVSDFQQNAVLRWRLQPGEWRLVDDVCTSGQIDLSVTADVPVVRRELVEGWESRYYMQREPIPVLEVEIAQPGCLQTIISW